ncbi:MULTISPECIES: fumarylacetoacetate hydrolase family protein [Bradyrhizobium]|uniref:5-carboxymethyl-2-hydroxymuconate isomerase n=3 Tax=Bradyrhizobium TaxID=374 RepID=A0AAE6CCM6_9BRAD|nr:MULTISPECIES: fumarylacetoacetate hydrolase family protein [Bradyrhizobium]MCG2628235.1 fumarylacetoacetate hydrolase family protein [Bradyrhizobium zhengyangense]MCG2643354.1 fumarylacetoacetate hydrolase family protein [Bradyrhizobium zhengyangense]MCG2670332.1 fumarylacetoacetate hydrolase family protein [Bradyrhizobium zhengyangense]MDN4985933.1 fumarylacetoacetate hydrolase family protein [Bradyrhizobium sp. WYCCWR 13022]MDN5002687.1 fumarylacetoacetate hydrolase family protein [Bradyr
MKVARFARNGSVSIGLVKGDGIISLSPFDKGLSDIDEVVAAEGWARAEKLMTREPDLKIGDVEFLPPLSARARVFCVGFNYKAHVDETGNEAPAYPTFFQRTHESFVGNRQLLLRPKVSERLDYEGELALIIGRTCHRVEEGRALDYVGGYTCLNEGSVRDYQKHSATGMTGKNFDSSGSIGPWIVAATDVPHPDRLALSTRLNGEVVQQASTSQLIYGLPRLISYLSSVLRLLPGDIIATGTPAGVGSRRVPPRWLRAGDRVEVEISGVGILENAVIDEPT